MSDPSRSMTRAAKAGSSESAEAPACSSSDSDAVPTAAATASAFRVRAGSASSLARTSSSSVSGTIALRRRREDARELEREERVPSGSFVDAEQRLPWKRRSESITQEPMQRADTQRADSDALHAVTTKRVLELGLAASRRSAAWRGERSRRSSPAAAGRRPARATTPGRATGRRRPRRAWRRRSLSSSSASRTATATVRLATGSSITSPRSSATSSARRRGGGRSGSTSSTIGSKRSPRPTYVNPRSGSEGRDDSTCSPCARAYSTAASHSVDFPMPASPSRTSAAASSPSTKASKGGELGVPADDLATPSDTRRA